MATPGKQWPRVQTPAQRATSKVEPHEICSCILMPKVRDLFASRIIRFLVTGGAATATHVVVFVGLVEIFRLSPVFASIPAFVVALCVSYVGNRNWTFRSTGSLLVEFPKYALVAVSGLAANVAITYSVVDLAGLSYLLALIPVITVVPVATFLISHRWVFSRQ